VTRAQFFVLCTGYSAKPYIPAIAGLQDFRGICHHTSLWPQEGVDFNGKRVGVIAPGRVGCRLSKRFIRTSLNSPPMRDGQGEILVAERRWLPRLVLRAGQPVIPTLRLLRDVTAAAG
jgi:hypothetical protein